MLEHEPPASTGNETRAAIEGYRDAMNLILQMAPDLTRLTESLLRSLHFMMLKHDPAKHPGRWRAGPVHVADADGRVLYTPPDRALVPALVVEALEKAAEANAPAMVRGAFAHLDLVMIHPFSDGNGRISRVAQSFILAGEGDLSPVFLSIEEYMGGHTQDYYAVLRKVGGDRWSPERDARPWLEFCLTAHYRQALMVLRLMRETEALWDRVEQMTGATKAPSRAVGALVDAARGLRLTRSLYVKITQAAIGDEISDDVASRDMRSCVDKGLLAALGEKRGRTYRASEALAAAWHDIRSQRPAAAEENPYEAVGREG